MAVRQDFIAGHEPLIASAYLRGDTDMAVERFDAALEDFQRVYEREPRFTALLRLAGKGMYGGEALHRRLLLAAAVPVLKLRSGDPDGLLPYMFLRTGAPRHFTVSFGNRLLPGNSVVLIYLWDSSDTSLAVRESDEFRGFAERTGLQAAWDRYGPPDRWR